MDNFIVSARKYRPVTFESVVGQQHVTNTLKNAIKNSQLAQAFLFCGPRGVGKTTCARILAKTINCTNLQPNGEACGECDPCRAFQQGTSFNVHELDAASNNSVDDIRSLIEQVRIPPQAGKFKVYIIDEVHMLSQAAFNAFLKTLEEPPNYAIFILATTEKHKILPTILSRCQIFDFNRIKVEDMADHLASIAQKESIGFEPDGLHIIAQKADGGLRDALSMFDQIVSFSGGKVTYRSVIDNLNILDYDHYFNITDSLLGEDTAKTLLIFDEILSKGFDGSHFISGLCGHLRNLLVTKDAATVKLLEVSEGIRQKYVQQAQRATVSFLLSALNMANQCELNYKLSKNQRLQVELALLKICHLPSVFTAASMPAVQASPNGEALKKNSDPGVAAPAAAQPVMNAATEAPRPVAAPPVPEPVVNEPKPAYTAGATPSLSSTPSLKAAPPEPVRHVTEPLPSASPQPEAAKPEAPVRPLATSLLATPSLSPSLKGGSMGALTAVEDEEDPYLKGTDNESFTTDEFMKCWMDHVTKVKADGKATLVTILTSNAPVMLQPYVFEVIVSNRTQENVFREEKPGLMNHLRTTLRNFSIEVNTRIDEQTVVRKPYTALEKFQHMAAKNPQLLELRKRLNLELD
ncbi:DNA polymerase III subunit gamma/tau [Mucilaginibacter daejeonensis]|uniref:DNA polymerase III subunit gamma/tau n=1 Tax=Mucilaginibacter daejeonensis TaxID=398049 RepID=UPI001D172A9B|nr:DNA polymerase III subunit gamma/tau [Mucilaginibacter daejeonensis]UEG52616.1 DNA polymerase III subunit gamma/tau [Mucilaginibacter daejeonensis]